MAEVVIWEGAESLRPFLVPIDQLEPFPGNPRRGDVAAVRASLRRFGQVRPSLVDASGRRLVAGHHVRLAAAEEGWTHIAVMPNEFADEDEARAYLLADNRIPELGGYDNEALVGHLKHLAELDALTGTGYTIGDLDDQLARLRAAAQPPPPPGGNGDPPPPPPDVSEVVLLYSPEQRTQLDIWQAIVAKEKGTHGLSETIYEGMRIAALQVNG